MLSWTRCFMYMHFASGRISSLFLLRTISSTKTGFITLYTTCITKKSNTLFSSHFLEPFFLMFFSCGPLVSSKFHITFPFSLKLQNELVPTERNVYISTTRYKCTFLQELLKFVLVFLSSTIKTISWIRKVYHIRGSQFIIYIHKEW